MDSSQHPVAAPPDLTVQFCIDPSLAERANNVAAFMRISVDTLMKRLVQRALSEPTVFVCLDPEDVSVK